MVTIAVSDRTRHAIDPKIYGHFIEDLGEGIHDGLWACAPRLASLPRVDDARLHGVRRDLFEAIARLARKDGAPPTVLRWPGGCFADTYHWRDGIGPWALRPVRRNRAWNRGFLRFVRSRDGVAGPDSNNQFGTDEFLLLCEQLGVEPYLNVNYGSGTPEEAADWVEYANGAATTNWGAARASRRPEPYGVKYWGIGNEVWGRWETGHERTAEAYTARYLEFARAMRQSDPTIRLIACGIDRTDRGPLLARDSQSWNRTLLRRLEGQVDFLSLHYYVPFQTAPWNMLRRSTAFARTRDAYYALLASPRLFCERIERMWDDVKETLGKDAAVRIAFDEWNLWFHLGQIIKANFTLADGLWVACLLQVLQEHADKVGMANLAQLVNVLGLIRTDDTGIVETPSYHAFHLLRQGSYDQYLETEVACPAYTSPRALGIPPIETPYLSCGATRSAGGHVGLSIVNRHLDAAIAARIELRDFGARTPKLVRRTGLHHAEPFARNTPEERTKVQPRVSEADTERSSEITLPPCSLTVLQFE